MVVDLFNLELGTGDLHATDSFVDHEAGRQKAGWLAGGKAGWRGKVPLSRENDYQCRNKNYYYYNHVQSGKDTMFFLFSSIVFFPSLLF